MRSRPWWQDRVIVRTEAVDRRAKTAIGGADLVVKEKVGVGGRCSPQQ